jgi:hypothetical protein
VYALTCECEKDWEDIMMNEVTRLSMLQKPTGPVDVVLDTDAYNEIDDQYAIAYLIRNGEYLHLKALYAAPFAPVYNKKVASVEEGLEKSYLEIFKVLAFIGREDLSGMVYRGSERFLADEKTPVISDAAKDLAERAMQYTSENPLYVIAIGAITNVASALLLNPEIADRIVVVWLGGHSFEWPDNHEFNCFQDVAAVRVVFDRVPVVLIPCKGVVSAFSTTRYELEHWLKGQNSFCDYLYEITAEHASDNKRGPYWSKPIWDVTAVAWLLPGKFMDDRLEPAPIAEYDDHWAFDRTRPLIRYVYHIHRDALMGDLFEKLREIE